MGRGRNVGNHNSLLVPIIYNRRRKKKRNGLFAATWRYRHSHATSCIDDFLPHLSLSHSLSLIHLWKKLTNSHHVYRKLEPIFIEVNHSILQIEYEYEYRHLLHLHPCLGILNASLGHCLQGYNFKSHVQ